MSGRVGGRGNTITSAPAIGTMLYTGVGLPLGDSLASPQSRLETKFSGGTVRHNPHHKCPHMSTEPFARRTNPQVVKCTKLGVYQSVTFSGPATPLASGFWCAPWGPLCTQCPRSAKEAAGPEQEHGLWANEAAYEKRG